MQTKSSPCPPSNFGCTEIEWTPLSCGCTTPSFFFGRFFLATPPSPPLGKPSPPASPATCDRGGALATSPRCHPPSDPPRLELLYVQPGRCPRQPRTLIRHVATTVDTNPPIDDSVVPPPPHHATRPVPVLRHQILGHRHLLLRLRRPRESKILTWHLQTAPGRVLALRRVCGRVSESNGSKPSATSVSFTHNARPTPNDSMYVHGTSSKARARCIIQKKRAFCFLRFPWRSFVTAHDKRAAGCVISRAHIHSFPRRGAPTNWRVALLGSIRVWPCCLRAAARQAGRVQRQTKSRLMPSCGVVAEVNRTETFSGVPTTGQELGAQVAGARARSAAGWGGEHVPACESFQLWHPCSNPGWSRHMIGAVWLLLPGVSLA
jgi:hypothetical protein